MAPEFPNTIRYLEATLTLRNVEGVVKAEINGSLVSIRKIAPIVIQCQECDASPLRKNLTLKLATQPYLCPSCSKTGERNGFYGRKHSDEFKKKLSDERKGAWGVGEANPMYGVNVWEYVSEEKREEMREKNRIASSNWEENPFRDIKSYIGEERWREALSKQSATVRNRTPEEKAAYSAKQSAAATRQKERDPEGYRAMKQRAGRVAAQRKPYTKNKLEERVEAWLEEHGVKVTYGPILGDGTHNYQFDFIAHGRRVLIECHGTYWHAHSDFYPSEANLDERQRKNRKRDLRKARFAASKGFRLLVIWEHDVKRGDFSALEELLSP